jgi:hypothetical protein
MRNDDLRSNGGSGTELRFWQIVLVENLVRGVGAIDREAVRREAGFVDCILERVGVARSHQRGHL